MLGMELDEVIAETIAGMQKVADQIGLGQLMLLMPYAEAVSFGMRFFYRAEIRPTPVCLPSRH